MNSLQKVIVCCTFAALAANVLYPPFHVKTLGIEVKNGHHFIAEPPNPLAKVDWIRVGAYSVVIVTVGLCAAVVFSGRRRYFS